MNDVTPGTPIRFRHGNEVLDGIVNGDPFMVWDTDILMIRAYVPAHVPDGNLNILVAAGNVYEAAAA